MTVPSQFRVIVSLVILLAFLSCSWGSLFCPMVYASEKAVPHHSTSQSDPLEHDAGCPELAVASMVSWGDMNSAILPIGLEATIDHRITSAFASLLPDRSLTSSSYPLLFLLLSNLRN